MTRWVILALTLSLLLGACGRYGKPVRPKPGAPPSPTATAVQEAPAPGSEASKDAEASEDDEEE